MCSERPDSIERRQVKHNFHFDFVNGPEEIQIVSKVLSVDNFGGRAQSTL